MQMIVHNTSAITVQSREFIDEEILMEINGGHYCGASMALSPIIA